MFILQVCKLLIISFPAMTVNVSIRREDILDAAKDDENDKLLDLMKKHVCQSS